MYITWQTIITVGAVITALTVIITLFVKVVRFIDRQKAQDEEIKSNRAEREKEIADLRHKVEVAEKALREQHSKDMAQLRKEEHDHVAAMKQEQTLLVYGILACLKGLKEQGCNGPVTEAISKIEKHINQKAHE